jgi:hypothetical protein
MTKKTPAGGGGPLTIYKLGEDFDDALAMVKVWFAGLTITQQNRALAVLESANDDR